MKLRILWLQVALKHLRVVGHKNADVGARKWFEEQQSVLVTCSVFDMVANSQLNPQHPQC